MPDPVSLMPAGADVLQAGSAGLAGGVAATAEGMVRQGAGKALPALDTAAPFRVMHRLGINWLEGAGPAQRFESLIEMLRVDGFSDDFVRAVESKGPGLLRTPVNRIPKSLWTLAGGTKMREKFSQNLGLVRKFGKKVPESLQKEAWTKSIRLAEEYLHPRFAAALKKGGPAMAAKFGPGRVLSTYDRATRSPLAARAWRKFFGGKELAATRKLSEAARNVFDELGKAEAAMPSISEAKGLGGKAQAAGAQAKALGGRVKGAMAGTAAPEAEIAAGLRKAGVKGMGLGKSALRKAGGVFPMVTGALLGYTAWDSIVGKKKRARGALDAYRRGQGRASPSMQLIRDVLSKREAVSRRRAALGQDPALMQQVVQALAGGGGRGRLTPSEVGLGAAAGAPGGGSRVSTEQLDEMLERLLSQMEGM